MNGPIVAIGGAEFQKRAENEALHDYIVSLIDRPSPRICLLPTASGDPHDQIGAFYEAMERRGCVPSAISLFRLGDDPIDFAAHLLDQDAIYVTGGSMVNLLALWREHGIDEVMTEAHQRGILLCGYSAGSMCWFESGVTRGGGAPAAASGLGLLAGSHCVHYSQDPARRDAYRKAIAGGLIAAGIALDDHAAALFRDGVLVEAVRSRETSSAYRVERVEGEGVEEIAQECRLLPVPETHPEPGLAEMRELRRMRADRPLGPGRLGRRG